MLFWDENENEEDCKICGASRWVVVEKKSDGENNPKKLILSFSYNEHIIVLGQSFW